MNAPVTEVTEDGETLARWTRGGDTALPAGRLRPRGELIWFVDHAAETSL